MVEGIKDILSFANSLTWTPAQLIFFGLCVVVAMVGIWFLAVVITAPMRAQYATRRASELSEQSSSLHQQLQGLIETNSALAKDLAQRVKGLEGRSSISADVERELGIAIVGQLSELPDPVRKRLDDVLKRIIQKEMDTTLPLKEHWIASQIRDAISGYVKANLTKLPPDLSGKIEALVSGELSEHLARALIRERLDDLDCSDLDEKILVAAKDLLEQKNLPADVSHAIAEATCKYLEQNGSDVVDGHESINSAIVEAAQGVIRSDDPAIKAAIAKTAAEFIEGDDGKNALSNDEEIPPTIVSAAKILIEKAAGDPSHPLHNSLIEAAKQRLEAE